MNGEIGLDGNGCKIHKKRLSNGKWLLVVCILSVTITPSWSTCSYPLPLQNGIVEPVSPANGAGQFQNQSKANVKCYTSHHHASPDFKILVCINDKWANTPDGNYVLPICVRNKASDKCETVPELENGFYSPIDSPQSGHSGDGSYPAGTQLQPACEQDFHLNCPSSHHTRHQCGRITCQHDGTWSPVDGQIIKSCVTISTSSFPGDFPLTVPPSNGDQPPRSNSTLKNYLVITLAIICILIVGALTVALLRRPLFCKKREHCEEAPVMMGPSSSSAAPCGPAMDSLPVAMNTGIFLPGAGYDLQDTYFQDAPIVGTAVFK